MITTDEMIRFLLDELGPEDAERVQAEIAASAETRALAGRVGRMLDALERARDLEPDFMISESLRRSLHGLAPDAPKPALASSRDLIERVIATLLFDSWLPGMAPAGIRGGDGSRRLRYEFEDGAIELRIEPNQSRLASFDCTGRVEGRADAELSWHEVSIGSSRVLAIDEDGFFECTVESGAHRIELKIADRVFATPEFHHPPRESP
jgi:hypothetical protein